MFLRTMNAHILVFQMLVVSGLTQAAPIRPALAVDQKPESMVLPKLIRLKKAAPVLGNIFSALGESFKGVSNGLLGSKRNTERNTKYILPVNNMISGYPNGPNYNNGFYIPDWRNSYNGPVYGYRYNGPRHSNGYYGPGNGIGYNGLANSNGYNGPGNGNIYNGPGNSNGYNRPGNINGNNYPGNSNGYNGSGNSNGYNGPGNVNPANGHQNTINKGSPCRIFYDGIVC